IVDGYVYNASKEPKILMTGKWTESMSYQPCDEEGKPLSGTEPKEMWRVPDVPLKDKYQFTYLSHKVNSLDTAPRQMLASDSRLRPDRYALEKGELSKVSKEKNILEVKQRKERKSRETNGDTFTPKWFDLTNEVVTTPYGETPIYKYNYKYNEHRAKVNSLIEVVQPIEFNPWQYGQEKMA
ncbi:oxysterol-binding protein-related protein 3B-like, partial [Papaver somniferum]|uniref:oxysterol-binding protein-related protein 3B-like n=1 Tax=Papaver somniferum TaxID=3469 RepID=UPI000E6F6230